MKEATFMKESLENENRRSPKATEREAPETSDSKEKANICFDFPNKNLDKQACPNGECRSNEAEASLTAEESEATQEEKSVTPQEAADGGIFSENVFGTLYALAEAFPEKDVARDVSSKAFRLFAAGKSGDITSIYEAYLAFRKAWEDGQPPKETADEASFDDADQMAAKDNGSRSFSSFSGGAPLTDYGETLTARQMLIARQSGMSYREYAELLRSVPQGRRCAGKL